MFEGLPDVDFEELVRELYLMMNFLSPIEDTLLDIRDLLDKEDIHNFYLFERKITQHRNTFSVFGSSTLKLDSFKEFLKGFEPIILEYQKTYHQKYNISDDLVN